MPKTSGEGISDGGYYDKTESYGGFFGDTKFFYSESDFPVGTDHKDENTHFVFR
jgi:hypothetical protein